MSEGSDGSTESWGATNADSDNETMTDETDYIDLIDSIATDPDRSGADIETGILFNHDSADSDATVHTGERGLMKRLLHHPHFDLAWYVTTTGEGTTHVTAEQYEEEGHDGRKPVYGISGSVPINCLKIAKNPRETGGNAEVVTSTVLGE